MRVISWNLNHCFRRKTSDEAWAYLWSLEPDIALLQEVARPPASAKALWQGLWDDDWGTAIVAQRGLELREIPSVSVTSIEPIPSDHLERSQRGAWLAADVDIPGFGAIAVISVYGAIRKLRNGIEYATTGVQRTLSDLTPVLDVRRSKAKVILGGDLNVSPQIGPPDHEAHMAVIDRIKAFGMVDCLGSKNVGPLQTHRHRNKIGGTPWQIDWMFASPSMRLVACAPNDEEGAWSLSDHCPVVADFEP